jgi:hypothetical protein
MWQPYPLYDPDKPACGESRVRGVDKRTRKDVSMLLVAIVVLAVIYWVIAHVWR